MLELTNSLKELEAIVQRKQANVRSVEEGNASLTLTSGILLLTPLPAKVLRQKLMAAQNPQASVAG